MVGSTQKAVELGDEKWKDLVDRHHAVVRRELRRFGGREVDTAGDGFLALFGEPGQAVRCAGSIVKAVRSLGIEVRAGLHTGECELVGTAVRGVAVHVAARVMSLAGPSEVLVSGTVREIIAGSVLRFEERGRHELKGIPGEWPVFSLREDSAAATLPERITPAPGPSKRPVLWWLAGAGVLAGIGVGVGLVLTGGGTTPRHTSPAPPAPVSLHGLIRIDPGGGPPKEIDVSDAVTPAIEPNHVWVATSDAKYMTRKVSPTENTVIGTIDHAGFAVAATEDAMWSGWEPAGFLASSAEVEARPPFLVRVDPATNKPVASIRVETPPEVSNLAIGEGAVWYYEPLVGHLLEISPSSDHVIARIALRFGFSGAGIAGLAVGESAVMGGGTRRGR
ncbi:MAG: adenylate/guanylate cyclase domain-containing protein [Actinomycetota bacterium]